MEARTLQYEKGLEMEEYTEMNKAFKKGQLELAKSVVISLFSLFILATVLVLVLSEFQQTSTIQNDNDSSAIIDKAKTGVGDFVDLAQLGFILAAVVIVLGLVGVGIAVMNRQG